jgi:hypothetical protein
MDVVFPSLLRKDKTCSVSRPNKWKLDEEKWKHAQFSTDPTNENWMKKSQNMLSFPESTNENWMKKSENMLSFQRPKKWKLDEEKTKHAQFPDLINENWMKKRQKTCSVSWPNKLKLDEEKTKHAQFFLT